MSFGQILQLETRKVPMIVVILALAGGCIPSLIVFFWLRGYLHIQEEFYKKNCTRMLTAGLLTIFPVFLLSTIIAVLLNLSGLKSAHPVLYAALFAFLTYALSEELSKFYMFRRRLRKTEGSSTWLDLIIYSTIVGIGFGLLESIVYVMESGPLVMLIRGISIPHGGYAAIVGYFFGKSVKENKKSCAVFGIFVTILIHGLYDFSLSEELGAVTDLAAFIALPLAVLDVVIIIALIVFIRKHKNDPKYTEPLLPRGETVPVINQE